LDLLEHRDHLSQRILAFEKKADAFIKLDEETVWAIKKGKEHTDDGSGTDEDDTEWDNDPGSDTLSPEEAVLLLPSSLGPGEVSWLGHDKIASQEAASRHGQVNNALCGLHLALGEKSLLLHTDVWNAKSQ
jgi:hypothetical protein